MQTCRKCGAQNRAEARRCMNCAADLQNFATVPDTEQFLSRRLCPSGKHPMDPMWSSCPYCTGKQQPERSSTEYEPGLPPPPPQSGKRGPTLVESEPLRRGPTLKEGGSAPLVSHQEVQTNPSSHGTSSTASQSKPKRKATEFGSTTPLSSVNPVFSNQTQPFTRHQLQTNVPRIVAILITYTWEYKGQIFPVVEGRNYLGSDPEKSEIFLETDSQISGVHAAIFCRGEEFIITDEKSRNGTFVNGQIVPFTGMSLQNYSQICTGSTQWIFVRVQPDFE